MKLPFFNTMGSENLVALDKGSFLYGITLLAGLWIGNQLDTAGISLVISCLFALGVTYCLSATIQSVRHDVFHYQPKNLEYDADVIIIGAGVVGAALAAKLGRDGKRVILIER